jgi:hypothetical protein
MARAPSVVFDPLARAGQNLRSCSSHSSGNPASTSSSCNSASCRPSRIASTISGASRVSRRAWLTEVLPIPLLFARSSLGCVHAGVEHLPPRECPRQRLDHGVVDARPLRPRRAVRRHHQLPPATLPEGNRWLAARFNRYAFVWNDFAARSLRGAQKWESWRI